MKKFFILILLLLIGLASYSYTHTVDYLGMKLPLPGKTIADTRAQANALGPVFASVAKSQRRCNKLKVTDTRVTKKLSGVRYNQRNRRIDGNWSEEWTVNACGTNVSVPVQFQIMRNGVMPTVGTPKVVK